MYIQCILSRATASGGKRYFVIGRHKEHIYRWQKIWYPSFQCWHVAVPNKLPIKKIRISNSHFHNYLYCNIHATTATMSTMPLSKENTSDEGVTPLCNNNYMMNTTTPVKSPDDAPANVSIIGRNAPPQNIIAVSRDDTPTSSVASPPGTKLVSSGGKSVLFVNSCICHGSLDNLAPSFICNCN